MSDKHPILVVDDDAMNIEIAVHLLGDTAYRYNTASNGLDALARIAHEKPEVVLLDILMPEMDGLETCRQIRSNPDNNDITILFVTSQDDPETRLSAYDAGGDDILAKPLSAQVIRHKVESALKNRQLVSGLRKEVSDTMNMLMTSLSTTGEYGVVMHTLRNSLACRSLGDLADVLLVALDNYGLKGAVQLRTPDNILTLNSERRSSPIEQEMLRNLSVENRHVYDYGNRTVFCYPNVALLVRNMPIDNEDVYGRLKDNLALMAESAEFRLAAMVVELKTRNERANLVTAVSMLNFVLSQVDTQFKRGQSEMTSIFNELENKLEWSFAGLALTEDQEKGLWNIVRPLAARASALYESGVLLDQQLEGALATLRTSLNESGEQM
jgi:CheY-like chemotaxis protein